MEVYFADAGRIIELNQGDCAGFLGDVARKKLPSLVCVGYPLVN
jgi:hypothetical protein